MTRIKMLNIKLYELLKTKFHSNTSENLFTYFKRIETRLSALKCVNSTLTKIYYLCVIIN